MIDLADMREFEERRRRAKAITGTGEPLDLKRPMPVWRYQPESEDHRPYATSRNPCEHCGTRGELGCEHQRPFVPEIPDILRTQSAKGHRRGAHLFRKVVS